ncbi:GntR family transcriptional regulator [Nesterenkonia lacusekhoensis]|uniref:DNA-binding GntR family transcriptional regulator n=1 Tax=Nesterenkonia lacusekhoensis TaxID=150832 RepID=A0ABS4T5D3_9MICC|nr:GntR family transcriptional regulator [Nesterenkonia lacusekhoensis]MBP2319194.1 DNA-binding GntR family transcriptional regulator [Nesterenkonia lacusekhoensis]
MAAEGAGDVQRGRPRIQESADRIVASVLATAGPRVGTREFSTRRVAELTGLSQTLVSRAFRRIRGGAGGVVTVAGEEVPLRLKEMEVTFPSIRLVFEPVPAVSQRVGPTAFSRRAAALMAALWVSGAAEWTDPEAPAARRVEFSGTGPREGAVPANSTHLGEGGAPTGSLSVRWRPGERPWEEFLAEAAALLDRCAAVADAIPGELLRLLAARAGRGLHGVSWAREESAEKTAIVSDSDAALAVAEYPPPGRAPQNPWLPKVELSVTEQIAIALRKEIMDSGYRAGDRITPGPLAATLGLGVGTVRSAMRRLADDGLLASAEGGFSVPAVTGADVIDLYAARLHVGMVLLRGCATAPRHRLLPVRLALGAVEAAAAEGTLTDVGQADLQFQQELAEAAGLEQSARSFHALTLRVRMFISVLQLDYTPAVDRIVGDDRRILSAVLEGRAEDAVRTWRSKLDHAVRHMSALAPESFDADLWSRLSR